MHRELGLIGHARDQRSRFLDERLDVFGFERRVMSGHAGPDLEDPHRCGLVGCADDVVDTAGVALKQLGSLQQIVDQVIAPIRLNRELAEESIVHPGTLVAASEVVRSIRQRILRGTPGGPLHERTHLPLVARVIVPRWVCELFGEDSDCWAVCPHRWRASLPRLMRSAMLATSSN